MISIHKSHTRNDMISMIEHLPLPIMVAKTDMKDDLKKKFIKVINYNVSLNFKSLKYPEVTNITELLCYLKLENPRRRMTSKEKDNIIALSKKIIHYCDMDYSTELSDYNTQQEIIDDMNYIRQYGDGDWKPVVIKTANWTDRTYRKNKLYQYEITVSMANKINTQRGS